MRTLAALAPAAYVWPSPPRNAVAVTSNDSLRFRMMTRARISLLGIALLAGCASSQTHLSVPIDPTAGRRGAPAADSLVAVTVHDKRWKVHADGTREAAFGASMGDVEFAPAAPVIVQQRLELDLGRIAASQGAIQRSTVECDLYRFGVRTDTSPLYWDVVVSVSLVLKQSGRDSVLLASTATNRTWAWPGEEVISKTVYAALDSLSAKLNSHADAFAFTEAR